jgi:hypothetical protein
MVAGAAVFYVGDVRKDYQMNFIGSVMPTTITLKSLF